jgi:hypothetical protein
MQSRLCLRPESVEAWFESNPTRFPANDGGTASRKHANPVFIIEISSLSPSHTHGKIHDRHHATQASFQIRREIFDGTLIQMGYDAKPQSIGTSTMTAGIQKNS